MKKLALHWSLVALVAGTFFSLPGTARANVDVSQINVTYHGGALIQRVKVVTLFWGKAWTGAPLTGYLNDFFRALFADGRYMANLAQYSQGQFQIGNGSFGSTAADETQPPARVTNSQIQAEIRSQIAAGKLQQPDANTLFAVFTPPNVVVDDGTGKDSEHDFLGYHDYADDGQFAYAVLPYEEVDGEPRVMTLFASHELAEAVTDPEPGLQARGMGGWYDEQYGEIGDIPAAILNAGQIGVDDFADVLTDSSGNRFLVQKEWSVRDNAPVAFATAAAGPQPTPGAIQPGSTVTVVTR
jgi:hypothetical protein